MLNLMGLGDTLLPLDASGGPGRLPDDNLVRVRERFAACYRNLAEASEPGLISTYAHPTTYATCCQLYLGLSRGESSPVHPRRGQFDVGAFVTDEGSRRGWEATYVNPPGFRAPLQTELARLQMWTLKPRSRTSRSSSSFTS